MEDTHDTGGSSGRTRHDSKDAPTTPATDILVFDTIQNRESNVQDMEPRGDGEAAAQAVDSGLGPSRLEPSHSLILESDSDDSSSDGPVQADAGGNMNGQRRARCTATTTDAVENDVSGATGGDPREAAAALLPPRRCRVTEENSNLQLDKMCIASLLLLSLFGVQLTPYGIAEILKHPFELNTAPQPEIPPSSGGLYADHTVNLHQEENRYYQGTMVDVHPQNTNIYSGITYDLHPQNSTSVIVVDCQNYNGTLHGVDQPEMDPSDTEAAAPELPAVLQSEMDCSDTEAAAPELPAVLQFEMAPSDTEAAAPELTAVLQFEMAPSDTEAAASDPPAVLQGASVSHTDEEEERLNPIPDEDDDVEAAAGGQLDTATRDAARLAGTENPQDVANDVAVAAGGEIQQ